MLTIERLFFDIESVCGDNAGSTGRKEKEIECEKKLANDMALNVKWHCTDEDFTI